jgi:hypothetical protein
VWPRHWVYHYNLAKAAADHLAELHEAVLEIEPDANHMRLVADEELLQDLYGTGSALVGNAVRAVQHLAEEIERGRKATLRGHAVEERINEALGLFTSDDYRVDPDYPGLIDLTEIRHALEHPTGANTYNDAEWDRVPLAWILSNRSLDAWAKFDRWFQRVATAWEEHRQQNPEPATLTVERGMESGLHLKKPRKSRSV